METNTTIIGRQVLAFDTHKVLGAINDLCIGGQSFAVEYLVLTSNATKARMALPFDKILSIGDTFIVIEKQDDALAADTGSVKNELAAAVSPIGLCAYSKEGNKLTTVESYEMDSTTGQITKITLEDQREFAPESYLFFTSEFMFLNVDPSDEAAPVKEVVEESAEEKKPVKKKTVKKSPERESSEEDATLKRFLLGQVLTDTVMSADGAFKAEKGETLTKEMLDDAEDHDALVLLTMSVDA